MGPGPTRARTIARSALQRTSARIQTAAQHRALSASGLLVALASVPPVKTASAALSRRQSLHQKRTAALPAVIVPRRRASCHAPLDRSPTSLALPRLPTVMSVLRDTSVCRKQRALHPICVLAATFVRKARATRCSIPAPAGPTTTRTAHSLRRPASHAHQATTARWPALASTCRSAQLAATVCWALIW
jgi:hypothetical protein